MSFWRALGVVLLIWTAVAAVGAGAYVVLHFLAPWVLWAIVGVLVLILSAMIVMED